MRYLHLAARVVAAVLVLAACIGAATVLFTREPTWWALLWTPVLALLALGGLYVATDL